MWDAVRGLREEGITVVLTTHYMEEADELCDRVAIIDHGKILVQDTPTALKGPWVRRSSTSWICAAGNIPALIEQLSVSRASPAWSLRQWRSSLCSWRRGPAVRCRSRGESLRSARSDDHRNSLETVFIRLTGRDLRE